MELTPDGDPRTGRVDYVAADGKELGTKELVFERLTAPNYVANYRYLDSQESVQVGEDMLVIRRPDERSLTLPPAQFAVDSGFHYLVLENFADLLDGKMVEFHFLSAARKSFIAMRLEPEPATNGLLQISLTLQNRLLAAFIDPIILQYDVKARRLMQYRGLTNVLKADGKPFVARIDYNYTDTAVPL